MKIVPLEVLPPPLAGSGEHGGEVSPGPVPGLAQERIGRGVGEPFEHRDGLLRVDHRQGDDDLAADRARVRSVPTPAGCATGSSSTPAVAGS